MRAPLALDLEAGDGRVRTRGEFVECHATHPRTDFPRSGAPSPPFHQVAKTSAPIYGAGGGFLTAPVGFGFEDFVTASRAIAFGFAERSVSVTSCSGLLSPRP